VKKVAGPAAFYPISNCESAEGTLALGIVGMGLLSHNYFGSGSPDAKTKRRTQTAADASPVYLHLLSVLIPKA